MLRFTTTVFMLLLLSSSAFAQESDELRIALDTVWLVVAGALVFFMQAGFALLESGMARAKNAINVIMKNYTDVCFGTIAFWLVGYGLMFGVNQTGWFGTDHFLLGDAPNMDYSQLFFQAMFAATAATIASGAMAERANYWGYILGSIVITAFIYAIYGSWAWGSLYEGEGWLKQMGFIDFAGSSVVHSVGAWCALAGIMVIGPRLGRFGPDGEARTIQGHNLTSVALGGFILWLAWFAFNGGSTGHAEARIGLIVLNTHLAASSGAVGAVLVLLMQGRPILLTTTVNGSLGGLVAITAGCATMSPTLAAVTGVVAGVAVVVALDVMERLRLDDVVGAVPVHGVCGAWGTLAAGLFYRGDMFNLERILVQLTGIAAGFLWAFPAALIMYLVIDKVIGLRADTLAEQRGLDYSEHSEVGYPEFQRDPLHEEIR